jgi:hypothetical protein
MKNKSILFVVALCAGLQVNMGFASQNQSWPDWFWAKFATAKKTAAENPKLEGPLLVGSYALAASRLVPGFENSRIFLGVGIGVLVPTLVDFCMKLSAKLKTEATKTKIKNVIAQLIDNSVLYPTRSSKFHALLKKDEFLQYIDDKDGLIQEICAELSNEINSVPYGDQRTLDGVIDKKMAEFRKIIMNHVTLEDQIKALDELLKKQPRLVDDVPTMQAFVSIYFRLKNKQAVESKLSSEERASRQLWATSAAKARTSPSPLVE